MSEIAKLKNGSRWSQTTVFLIDSWLFYPPGYSNRTLKCIVGLLLVGGHCTAHLALGSVQVLGKSDFPEISIYLTANTELSVNVTHFKCSH